MNRSEWEEMLTCVNPLPYPEIITQVAQCVPALLKTYFNVILSEKKAVLLPELIQAILKRVSMVSSICFGGPLPLTHKFSQLFPVDNTKDVTKMLLNNMSKILDIHPQYVIELKSQFVQTLQNSKEQVFVQLCHSVGDCVARCKDNQIATSTIVEYFEVLEIITFEQLAKARIEQKMGQQQAASTSVAVALNALISSMCKLCGKCPDLVSRVIVCLANLMKHSESLHASVVQRANEAIRLLRYPSILASCTSTADLPIPSHALCMKKKSHAL